PAGPAGAARDAARGATLHARRDHHQHVHAGEELSPTLLRHPARPCEPGTSVIHRAPAPGPLYPARLRRRQGSAAFSMMAPYGWGYEEKVRAAVAAVTKVPFNMDVRCSINAIQGLGASRIAIVAGFDHEQQEVMVSYLKNAGIEVAAHHSIPEARGDDQGTLPL